MADDMPLEDSDDALGLAEAFRNMFVELLHELLLARALSRDQAANIFARAEVQAGDITAEPMEKTAVQTVAFWAERRLGLQMELALARMEVHQRDKDRGLPGLDRFAPGAKPRGGKRGPPEEPDR